VLRVRVKDVRDERVFTFTGDVVTIGRTPQNDLVLRHDTVSRRHAKLVVDRAKREVVIEDVASTCGVEVASLMVHRSPVGPEDEIRLGQVRLRVWLDLLLPEDVDEDTEQTFLNALRVNPRDDETRAVYADWLEERGKAPQAEFLRTQIAARQVPSADDPRFAAASRRLRALAEKVGAGWRARVAMTFIEATTCGAATTDAAPLAFELECPKRWDEMTPTEMDGVRRCDVCKKDVVYCTSIEEARTCAEDGGCVAIDAAVKRSPDDLLSASSLVRGRIVPNFSSRGARQGGSGQP
jgi:uncharacterized protein (TIGR02996 family)